MRLKVNFYIRCTIQTHSFNVDKEDEDLQVELIELHVYRVLERITVVGMPIFTCTKVFETWYDKLYKNYNFYGKSYERGSGKEPWGCIW
jgi:hypothetical protein